jgi:hypothetical protein
MARWLRRSSRMMRSRYGGILGLSFEVLGYPTIVSMPQGNGELIGLRIDNFCYGSNGLSKEKMLTLYNGLP